MALQYSSKEVPGGTIDNKEFWDALLSMMLSSCRVLSAIGFASADRTFSYYVMLICIAQRGISVTLWIWPAAHSAKMTWQHRRLVISWTHWLDTVHLSMTSMMSKMVPIMESSLDSAPKCGMHLKLMKSWSTIWYDCWILLFVIFVIHVHVYLSNVPLPLHFHWPNGILMSCS